MKNLRANYTTLKKKEGTEVMVKPIENVEEFKSQLHYIEKRNTTFLMRLIEKTKQLVSSTIASAFWEHTDGTDRWKIDTYIYLSKSDRLMRKAGWVVYLFTNK